MIWRILVLFISYWLLAAHFLRDGNMVICTLIALFPFLIFTKNIIALRALQFGLVLAVFVVWLPSTYSMVEYRIAIERPWLRMSVIMTAVMGLNFFATWCVSTLKMHQK